MAGALFLIGTPLGNLADLSPRAVETMRSLDTLYCEDTRHTGKLTAHFGLTVELRPLHDDSPLQHWQAAIAQVQLGKRIGYASDAGMPGVSDPGRLLLRAAWDAGLTPVVIPGPSATTTLVSYCPFIGTEFVFRGFVPRKDGERSRFIESLRESPYPAVVFESPLRAHRFLTEMCAALEPQREIVIGREMTKLHEQVLLFKAADWPELQADVPELGEFSIAVAARPPAVAEPDQQESAAALARLHAAGFSRRDALRALAAVSEQPLNKLKALAYAADADEDADTDSLPD